MAASPKSAYPEKKSTDRRRSWGRQRKAKLSNSFRERKLETMSRQFSHYHKKV